MSGPSPACCSLPPAQSGPYDVKGTYNEVSGLKTYVTGSTTAPIGIFVVYDIFGFAPPTLQGADILSKKALVVLPDYFEGKPMGLSDFPPDTDEKKAKLGAFFAGPANPAQTVEKAKEALKKVQAAYPEVKKWVVAGYCWGGKIATLLSSQEIDGLVGSVQIHPAFLDKEDATKIKVKHLALMSQDEDSAVVAEWKKAFEGGEKGQILEFLDVHHGWMGARAKLEEEHFRKRYDEGYKAVADFVASLA